MQFISTSASFSRKLIHYKLESPVNYYFKSNHKIRFLSIKNHRKSFDLSRFHYNVSLYHFNDRICSSLSHTLVHNFSTTQTKETIDLNQTKTTNKIIKKAIIYEIVGLNTGKVYVGTSYSREIDEIISYQKNLLKLYENGKNHKLNVYEIIANEPYEINLLKSMIDTTLVDMKLVQKEYIQQIKQQNKIIINSVRPLLTKTERNEDKQIKMKDIYQNDSKKVDEINEKRRMKYALNKKNK